MPSKLLCAWVLFSILAGPQPGSATLVLYEHSPVEILLATDSLTTNIHADGSLAGVTGCKLHQYGDAFVALSGFITPEILASLKRAAESASGGIETMEAFDIASRADIQRTLSRRDGERYAAEMGTGGGSSLDVVLVDPRNHVLVHAQYLLESDGSISHWRQAYSAAGKRHFTGGKWFDDSSPQRSIEMGAIGFYKQSMVEGVRRAPGLPFMAGMFERQIAHEESRVARGERARISGPGSILRIAQGKAEWIEQGACPAVER